MMGQYQTDFKDMGEKPFRAEQVMKWIYQQGVADFEQMTNLNNFLRFCASEGGGSSGARFAFVAYHFLPHEPLFQFF